MALNFPDNPSVDQVYYDSTSGFSYVWNGTVWISYESSDLATVVELDDISGDFDGSTTSFTLALGGTSITAETAAQLQISVGGVRQNPTEDYSIAGSSIVFTTAPASGLSFIGLLLGRSFPVSSVSAGSITLQDLDASAKGVGIRSDGLLIGYGATTFNFLGVGHTFKVSSGSVDIDLATGVGTPVNFPSGGATPFSYVDAETELIEDLVIDSTNAGVSTTIAFSLVPRVNIKSGVGLTVGVGKTLVIDALQLGG